MFLIIAGHGSKVNDSTQHVWFTHLSYDLCGQHIVRSTPESNVNQNEIVFFFNLTGLVFFPGSSSAPSQPVQ